MSLSDIDIIDGSIGSGPFSIVKLVVSSNATYYYLYLLS